MDQLVLGIAADEQIRVMSAVTTETVKEAVKRHQTSPTASAAMGRLLTGAQLLASSFKDFDRLTVRIDAEGPLNGIVAEADKRGNVRGYVKNPSADAELSMKGKFDVSSLVGGGMLHVIRESGFDMGLHKDPYVGSVPIVSGEIAEDIAHYLLKSEQIPSAVLLGVMLTNTEPFVEASGGVLIQMLPGANDHLATMIEDTIGNSPHVTELIREGATPEDLLKAALGEISFEVLETRPLAFKCNCSFERAESLIAALGDEEIESMITEDDGAVMNCGFCSSEYSLDSAQLAALLNRS
ncbi:MAG: Hsp33 family molecular chaperone HslO [Pyrinomonadaceae bacterium]|nr:Hsp33 family molecular chaperone HslO [Pyrinomonadaceae bacterium]